MGRKSLIETVRSCFSAKSLLWKKCQPYLSHHADRLSEFPGVKLSSGDNAISPELSSTGFWMKLKETTTEQTVVVVNDIDDHWCKALCTTFPQHINEKFLLEHILGLTLPAECSCDDGANVSCKAIAADVRRVSKLLAGRLDSPRGDFGFHISYWREPEPAMSRNEPVEACMLRRASERFQSHGFLSCCQLGAHLCKWPDRKRCQMFAESTIRSCTHCFWSANRNAHWKR
jgi:hypothetical protein